MASFSQARHVPTVSRRISYLAACGGLAAVMAGCGAATGGAPSSQNQSPTAAPAGGQVTLKEYKITVASTLKAGNGNFHFVNSGTVEHELLVFQSDLDISKYPVDSDGRILEDDASVTLLSDGEDIAPGGTQDRTIDLSKPGKYVFVCNLPLHFKQGMFAVVTVTP